MRDMITRSRVLLLATAFMTLAIVLSFRPITGVKAKTMPSVNVQPTELSAPPNPLLAKWEGPYGGVPPFDQVKVADFKPALEAAMAENLKEIDAIAKNPAKPDFGNTIAALERAGKPFERTSAIYRVFSSTMSTDDFQKVEMEMAPKLAAFKDRIVQNKDLFSRIAAVYEAREASGLTPEQK